MNVASRPPIFLEAKCDLCGELIFAERVNFPAWARLQTYWLGCLLEHAARHENGESGRTTPAPAPATSTGPEAKTNVERPDSNKAGRSDVDEEGGNHGNA